MPKWSSSARASTHQVIEGVGAGRCVRSAVTAVIVAQDAEAVLEQRDLIVPQGQVVAQRMAERYPRRAFDALDLTIDLKIPDADFHHCFPFRVCLLLKKLAR